MCEMTYSRVYHYSPAYFSLLPHMYRVPCSSNFPWFCNPNSIWWATIMKTLVMQLLAVHGYFLPLRPKYLLQKTHFMVSSVLPKIMPFMRERGEMWLGQTGRRRQYNTTHAFCMLDNWVYKHTRRICNTYCFSTATLVARTSRNVTLNVHCLSCFILMSICLCHLLLPVHNWMWIYKNLRLLQYVVSRRGLKFHLVVTDVAVLTRSQNSYAIVGLRIFAVSSKISACGEAKRKVTRRWTSRRNSHECFVILCLVDSLILSNACRTLQTSARFGSNFEFQLTAEFTSLAVCTKLINLSCSLLIFLVLKVTTAAYVTSREWRAVTSVK